MNSAKKSSLVIKENRLVEAQYKLNLNEQKFVLFAVSKIERGDFDKEYKFHIKEFVKVLGLEIDDGYKTLRRIIKKIMIHPLTLHPDSDTEIICNWFSYVKYKRNKAIISFDFAPALVPYLFNLKKKFTAYRLGEILQLNSVYSIRMYEILKQSEWLGGKVVKIDDLKKMLGISDSYKLYADFKRTVLDVAHEELRTKANIFFTYREIKKGRRVFAISFKVKTRKR